MSETPGNERRIEIPDPAQPMPPIILQPVDAPPPPLPREPEPEPFDEREITRAFVRPHRIIELILGGKDRLARNLTQAHALWALTLLLFLTSLLFTVPYGALSPARSVWKIAVLYTGSLLICFPCLHMFSQFLGIRFNLGQNLALSLVITSVAALFTFGFAPIIWFIDYSMRPEGHADISPAGLSVFLLCLALVMGIIQMGRCLVQRGGMGRTAGAFQLLIILWLPLLLFITYRMASLLELV